MNLKIRESVMLNSCIFNVCCAMISFNFSILTYLTKPRRMKLGKCSHGGCMSVVNVEYACYVNYFHDNMFRTQSMVTALFISFLFSDENRNKRVKKVK